MKAQDNDLWVKTMVSMVEFLRERHALSETEVSVIQADLRFAYLLGHLDGAGDTARMFRETEGEKSCGSKETLLSQ